MGQHVFLFTMVVTSRKPWIAPLEVGVKLIKGEGVVILSYKLRMPSIEHIPWFPGRRPGRRCPLLHEIWRRRTDRPLLFRACKGRGRLLRALMASGNLTLSVAFSRLLKSGHLIMHTLPEKIHRGGRKTEERRWRRR